MLQENYKMIINKAIPCAISNGMEIASSILNQAYDLNLNSSQ
jgi:hypothetical protein